MKYIKNQIIFLNLNNINIVYYLDIISYNYGNSKNWKSRVEHLQFGFR